MLNVKAKVKMMLRPGTGLYQRTVRSVAWAFMLRTGDRGLSVIQLIVVARFLEPSEFGIMGIALMTMVVVDTFSRTGLQEALIQKHGEIEAYLDAVWTILVIRGILLSALLFLIAPYVASFFNAPNAASIIRVISVSPLLQGLSNIGIVYFQKELEFSRLFFYQMSGSLAGFVVTISAALMLKSVWALVFGLLVTSIVMLLASYLLHPYRPRITLNFQLARDLFGFGKWVFISSVIVLIASQGDDVLVGKTLSLTALAFYQVAYKFSNAPATAITHVISLVSFPVYSKLQENIPSLKAAYFRTLRLTASISTPLAGGIFILAPEFTILFLGEKWTPMVPAMQVLALFALLRSIAATISPVLRALGNPRVDSTMQFIQLCLTAALIYPLTIQYDILGTSIAIILPFLLMIFVGLFVCTKKINARPLDLAKILFFPLAGTLFMVSIIYLSKTYIMAGDVTLVKFLVFAVIGIGVYTGFMLSTQKSSLLEIKGIFRALST